LKCIQLRFYILRFVLLAHVGVRYFLSDAISPLALAVFVSNFVLVLVLVRLLLKEISINYDTILSYTLDTLLHYTSPLLCLS
jgi:hypothetical protein